MKFHNFCHVEAPPTEKFLLRVVNNFSSIFLLTRRSSQIQLEINFVLRLCKAKGERQKEEEQEEGKRKTVVYIIRMEIFQ